MVMTRKLELSEIKWDERNGDEFLVVKKSVTARTDLSRRFWMPFSDYRAQRVEELLAALLN